MTLPRLRMFAGPNGSGKSTIKNVVPPALLGVFLNPDEIEKDIAQFGFLDVRDYGVETPQGQAPVEFQLRNTMSMMALSNLDSFRPTNPQAAGTMDTQAPAA